MAMVENIFTGWTKPRALACVRPTLAHKPVAAGRCRPVWPAARPPGGPPRDRRAARRHGRADPACCQLTQPMYGLSAARSM